MLSAAARLLDLADAAYTRQNDARQSLELPSASQVEAAVSAALGADQLTALRAEGRLPDAAPAVFTAALALDDGPPLLTSSARQ